MSLTNTILTKDMYECPECKNLLLDFNENPVTWCSKDTFNRCQKFIQGEEMIIEEGSIEFVARGSPKTKTEDGTELEGWSCWTTCFRCNKFLYADIIINGGKIQELRNIRTN